MPCRPNNKTLNMNTTKTDRSVEYRPGLENGSQGREYPDTPGPGRHFPARSEGVIVQKRKKNICVFFCISDHSEHFLFLGEKS